MTQRQMSERLKINQSVISRIESNAQSCSLKTILKIVMLLECDFKGAIISNIPLEKLLVSKQKVAEKY